MEWNGGRGGGDEEESVMGAVTNTAESIAPCSALPQRSSVLCQRQQQQQHQYR